MTGFFLFLALASPSGVRIQLQAPRELQRWAVGEFKVLIDRPVFRNPFTEVQVQAVFRGGGVQKTFPGFCDSEDGSLFRVRFAPPVAPAAYRYEITVSWKGFKRILRGMFKAVPSRDPGPVVVDPRHPRHFVYAGSGRHFYHLGYTAYHLLDPAKTEADIEETLEKCRRNGFNKIRFLLTGYPRDSARPARRQDKTGRRRETNPWRLPNYGVPPGGILPLPAWPGTPHRYDFKRFNLAHWRRCDRVVRWALRRGIIATCIMTIEKQGLPKELGSLTEEEKLLYRYAVARLGAFPNVWWDLGNEHNEYRWPGGPRAVDDPRSLKWAQTMGTLVHRWDPDSCLVSAHAYEVWIYGNARWADYIITQQYGEPSAVNSWALKYRGIAKPYVNEEYGYEGRFNKPGHGQNAELVRRCHWAIALAGGYATYGDWTEGAPFYSGRFGAGKAARVLRYLRDFFEGLPYWRMQPHNEVVERGFCLAEPGKLYVVYLPEGGSVRLKVKGNYKSRWYDPRSGKWRPGPEIKGETSAEAPDGRDWILLVEQKV